MIKAVGEYSNQFIGRAAFCVCSYRASRPYSFAETFQVFRRFGRMMDVITAYPLRQFTATNRDYAANPRSFGYLLGLTKEILSLGGFVEAVVMIDKEFSDPSITRQFEQVGPVAIRDIADFTPNDFVGFDTVILVYPDALGLGWSGVESKLLTGLHVPLFFANGRHRLMRLDSTVRRALVWRRLLATSRLTELCLSLLIVPLAMFWAAQDALRGKS